MSCLCKHLTVQICTAYSHPYLVQKVNSSNCSYFPCVVEESYISLCGGIKLRNLDVSKATQELFPDFCSDTVANGQSYFMGLVSVSLQVHAK